MADLGINPYERIERERTNGGWPWRMFSFVFFILLAVVVLYAGLRFGYGPFLKSRISQLDKNLSELATQIPQADQENFIRLYSQLTNLQSVLKNHVLTDKLFPLLEKNTNTRVSYTAMDLSTADGRINLEGVAPSYDILSQQLQAFAVTPEISKYVLTESQLINSQVHFRVVLFFIPDFFKS